jgi:hypothetical protein
MPADYQVARPVAAPNYVGMYSEGIKGALEPMNYLLNMQKELSEEDYRKAEIQNFLDDHADKATQLAETKRSNIANESMTALERQLEQQRVTETGRHDMADEAETQRSHFVDEDLAKQREQEYERAGQAERDQKQKDLDLRTEAQKYDLQYRQALTGEVTSKAKEQQQELEDKQNDNDVFDGLNSFIKDYSPNQIYGSNDNPELQQKIDEARRSTRTVAGRQRLDAVIGGQTALGRENEERIELNHMSKSARDVFQDQMLKSAPTGMPGETGTPTQVRFNDALSAARQEETRVQERNKWTDSGLTAYKQAKADGKDEVTAQGAGRMAEFKALSDAKAKSDEHPDPQMLKQLVEKMRGQVKRLPDESDEDFNARADSMNLPKATQMEQDMRLHPDRIQNLPTVVPNAKPTNNADDFTKSLLPTKPAGSPATNTIQGNPVSKPFENMPLGMVTPTSSSGGSALMPVSAPQYAAAAQNDQDNLFSSMRTIFGSPFGSQEGETEEA